jgi:hypothetical protein
LITFRDLPATHRFIRLGGNRRRVLQHAYPDAAAVEDPCGFAPGARLGEGPGALAGLPDSGLGVGEMFVCMHKGPVFTPGSLSGYR